MPQNKTNGLLVCFSFCGNQAPDTDKMLAKRKMKAILITACFMLSFVIASLAQTNDPTHITTNNLSLGEVLRKEKHLSTVASLPPSSAISNVVFSAFMNVGHGGNLTADDFRKLIESAKVLNADDPSIFAYHYAPWCVVSFEAKEGRYIANLCLGRGFLQYPDGRVVAFEILQKNAKNAANQAMQADGAAAPRPDR